MTTAAPSTTSTALDDVFDLDPQSTNLSALTVFSRFDASGNCTSNGCGPAPQTSGCATPDSPVLPVRSNNAV
jgi:hypothetical protein